MSKDLHNVYAVILAAGASRRFGSPKQLAGWQDGTLIQHSVKSAQMVFGDNVIVVIGAHQDQIEATLTKQPIKLVINDQWNEGLASSIRTGIEALPVTTEAALIMLCDQPLITSASLQQLTDTWRQHPGAIVASEYNGGRGVPALFPADRFNDLLQLEGDRGAKRLLNQPGADVLGVALPEAASDIDTKEDFEHTRARAHVGGNPA